MSMWQTNLSVEQLVALNMGDEDWEELEAMPGEDENHGCKRAKTMEVERSGYLEAEPMGTKYNPIFDN